MKKTVSVLCILLSLLLAVSAFAACGKQKTPEPDTAAPTDNAPDTEAPESTDEITEAPATVVYPTAEGGQAVQTYDISFYVPDTLTPNTYNGMLGVYEFYTGEYVNSRPSGLDITLCVSAESNTNGDLDAYARDASRKAAGAEVEPEEAEINGATWLRFTVGTEAVNYYAVFNDGLYEITCKKGGDTQENFDATVKMLEDTLFLAIADN